MLSKCELHSYQLHAHPVGCKNDFYVFGVMHVCKRDIT